MCRRSISRICVRDKAEKEEELILSFTNVVDLQDGVDQLLHRFGCAHVSALSVKITQRDLWRRRSTILCLVSNQDFKRCAAIICHANSIKFENRAVIKLDLSHFRRQTGARSAVCEV